MFKKEVVYDANFTSFYDSTLCMHNKSMLIKPYIHKLHFLDLIFFELENVELSSAWPSHCNAATLRGFINDLHYCSSRYSVVLRCLFTCWVKKVVLVNFTMWRQLNFFKLKEKLTSFRKGVLATAIRAPLLNARNDAWRCYNFLNNSNFQHVLQIK